MRLIVLYLMQLALLAAGFAAVCVVFSIFHSASTAQLTSRDVTRTIDLAAERVIAPFPAIEHHARLLAHFLRTHPQHRGNAPELSGWNESAGTTLSMSPSLALFYSLVYFDPHVAYAYESFEHPRSPSVWLDHALNHDTYVAARLNLTDAGNGIYLLCLAPFPPPEFSTSPLATTTTESIISSGTAATTAASTTTAQRGGTEEVGFVNAANCSETPNEYDPILEYHYFARNLTVNDWDRGKFTHITTYVDSATGERQLLLTLASPVTFAPVDPIDPSKGVYCNLAAMVDVKFDYLSNMMASMSASGLDFALFDDSNNGLMAWSLNQPPFDVANVSLLYAGATGSRSIDVVVGAIVASGRCSNPTVTDNRTSAPLATTTILLCNCDPSQPTNLDHPEFVFAMRRVAVINARFTLIAVGRRDDFFGPGNRALGIGIGISIVVFGVCALSSVALWLATQRPLRRLISNMALAAVFAEPDANLPSNITEMEEAEAAFIDLNLQLLAARPFMPQHILEEFGARQAVILLETGAEIDATGQPPSDTRSVTADEEEDARRQGLVPSERSSGRSSTRRSGDSGRYLVSVGFAPLETHNVAVLVIGLNRFEGLSGRVASETLQNAYALVMELILTAVSAHTGIVDAVHGDRFVATFNSSKRCASCSVKAVRTALLLLRSAQEQLQQAQDWAEAITCGISYGRSLTGPLGSTRMLHHATLGPVLKQASALQSMTHLLGDDSSSRILVTHGVAVECTTFAHVKCEFIVPLPGRARLQLVASIHPPPPRDGSSTAHLPSSTAASPANTNDEWLYHIGAVESSNPYQKHNEAMQLLLDQMLHRNSGTTTDAGAPRPRSEKDQSANATATMPISLVSPAAFNVVTGAASSNCRVREDVPAVATLPPTESEGADDEGRFSSPPEVAKIVLQLGEYYRRCVCAL